MGDSSEPRHDRSTITALKSRGINVKFVHNPRQALELVVISRVESFVSYRRMVHGWLFAIVQGGSPGLDVLNGPVPSLWRRKSNVGPI